ncbi:MAG: DUF4240 domain-containing protein [bacterium]|nr:DUF4240 domain-containing protein [bacterium]
MDEAIFWELVEQSIQESGGDRDKQTDVLYDRLVALPVDDIIDFNDLLMTLLFKAYTVNLWMAVILVKGFCSNDGFEDFRRWLVSKGKDLFYRVVDNPDTLVLVHGNFDNDDDYPSFEEFDYRIAKAAYETKTGEEEIPSKISIPSYPSYPEIGKPPNKQECLQLFPLIIERLKVNLDDLLYY